MSDSWLSTRIINWQRNIMVTHIDFGSVHGKTFYNIEVLGNPFQNSVIIILTYFGMLNIDPKI